MSNLMFGSYTFQNMKVFYIYCFLMFAWIFYDVLRWVIFFYGLLIKLESKVYQSYCVKLKTSDTP